MTILSWKIGEVEIYQIIEIEDGEIIQSIIKNASPENIRKIDWLMPHFADKSGKLKAVVQGFLVKSCNKNILIDTCIGNDKKRTDLPEWSNLKTDFLNNLTKTGVNEDDIDIVACTHIHMDHVGWNTKLENGVWVPTFPKAKYLFIKDEYNYWVKKPNNEIADDHASFDDSVTPIVNAGLAEFVPANHKIDKNVSFLSSPGHTPHHSSILIESQNQKAIISGDLLHHPCQIAKPDWSTESDTFPEQSIESRKKILNDIVDTETLLIGSHFANPVSGKVKKGATGFVLKH